jgi:hypothetical protein
MAREARLAFHDGNEQRRLMLNDPMRQRFAGRQIGRRQRLARGFETLGTKVWLDSSYVATPRTSKFRTRRSSRARLRYSASSSWHAPSAFYTRMSASYRAATEALG